jgi:hypothetical protein
MEQPDNSEPTIKARNARRLDGSAVFETAQLIKPPALRGVSDWCRNWFNHSAEFPVWRYCLWLMFQQIGRANIYQSTAGRGVGQTMLGPPEWRKSKPLSRRVCAGLARHPVRPPVC